MAVADVPGIDAFSLVTSGQSFVPSAADRGARHRSRWTSSCETYGAKGRRDHRRRPGEADGINAYWRANGIDRPPATVNDVIAVTAFIGSIFGAGGGGEATQRRPAGPAPAGPRVRSRGSRHGTTSCCSIDPEAPTTTEALVRLRTAHRRARHRLGRSIDAGSVVPLDPRQTPARGRPTRVMVDASAAPPRQAGVELPRGRARPVGHRQHPRGHGPAARLLLPGDRPADPPQRTGDRGPGRRRCRAWRCTSSSAAPTTTRGASRRPTTTCATCSPSSSASPTARRRPASRTTTCYKGSAARSCSSTRAR